MGHPRPKSFSYFEKNSEPLVYSVDENRDFFSTNLVRILQTTDFQQDDLNDEQLRVVLELIDEWQSNQVLDWATFSQESPLWNELSNRLAIDDAKAEFGDFLFAVARGPWVMFLPDVLGLAPCFSEEDRLGVELTRGRYNTNRETIDRRTFKRKDWGLHDLIRGLAALSVDDINRIRASDECNAYHSCCSRMAQGAIFPDELRVTFIEYQQRIDDAVFQVLKKHTGERESEYLAEQLDSRFSTWVKWTAKKGAIEAGKAAIDSLTLGGLTFCKFRLSECTTTQIKTTKSCPRNP